MFAELCAWRLVLMRLVSGTIVEGTFKCKKSEDNSRELDVEIHYTVRDPENTSEPGDVFVQLYKVR